MASKKLTSKPATTSATKVAKTTTLAASKASAKKVKSASIDSFQVNIRHFGNNTAAVGLLLIDSNDNVVVRMESAHMAPQDAQAALDFLNAALTAPKK